MHNYHEEVQDYWPPMHLIYCYDLKDLKDWSNGIFEQSLLGADCLDIGKDFEDSQINIKSVDPINAFLKLLKYLRIAAPLMAIPVNILWLSF